MELDTTAAISSYVDITTEWQHVKIPLKQLVYLDNGFNPANVTCLLFGKRHGKAFTVWFSDIKITSEDNEKSAPAIKVNQLGFVLILKNTLW